MNAEYVLAQTNGRAVEPPPDIKAFEHGRHGARPQAVIGETYVEIADRVAKSQDGPARAAAMPPKEGKKTSLWENGEFGFGDLLDVINPLQHLPIVATLYRNFTGDRLGIASRVIGGALWGRISGFVAGVVNAVVEWLTGKDIGDHIFAALRGALRGPGNESGAARAALGRADERKDAAESAASDRRAPELPPQSHPPRLRPARSQRLSEAGSAASISTVAALSLAPWRQLVHVNYRQSLQQGEILAGQRSVRLVV